MFVEDLTHKFPPIRNKNCILRSCIDRLHTKKRIFVQNLAYIIVPTYESFRHLGYERLLSCSQSEPTISDDGHVFVGSRRIEDFTNMGLPKFVFNWFISFRVDDLNVK
jgi:hypothetical protein